MKKMLIVPLLLGVLALSGCTFGQPQTAEASFFAMDTVMHFTVYGNDALLKDAQDVITDIESKVSVTNPDSELYTVNQNGSGALTGRAADLMEHTLSICQRTNGALDLSIYPIVRAWGFTTGNYQVPEESTITDLLSHVDYTKVQYDTTTGMVTLPDEMEIDLGSTGKGFAGQQAAALLREKGVTSALLNLGGNVQTIGTKPDGSPWEIAIQDPEKNVPMMVVSINDQAVVTSGGYERYFEQDGRTYWHIMDPSTGHPADSGLRSVSIIGDDGLSCDGLSTSLFVMGLEKAAELWAQSDDFEAVFVTDTGEVYITEGLSDHFALTKDYSDTPVNLIRR